MKKRLLHKHHKYFPVKFTNFFKKTFFYKTPQWLKVCNVIKKTLQYKCFPFKSIYFYRTPPVAASVLTQNWYLPAELDLSLVHFDYFQQVPTRHSLQISLLILSKFQQINQLLHLKPSENLKLKIEFISY